VAVSRAFNPGCGFGGKPAGWRVAANVTDLGGNVIDHDHLGPVLDSVDERSWFDG
jgi:hypothetical protein